MKRARLKTIRGGSEKLQIANCKLQIAKWLAPLRSVMPLVGFGGPFRSGTTLTEVLVSLMVMSIGVVSLTSIFPASLARSIRASQLTNATICRYNCEALLDADRSILLSVPLSGKAVIDPLGYNYMAADRAAFKDIFGNDGTTTAGSLTRLNGGRTSIAAADFLVTLPDSWTLVMEGAGSGVSATSVTVAGLGNFFGGLPANQLRITMFYEGSGRVLSISRIATALTPSGANATVTWADGIPATILTALSAGAVKVRVDQQNRNYTWMVTARRSSGTPTDTVTMDVAVFFRRSFSLDDERVHSANFRAGVRDVTITFAGITPPLKKGGYVFDSDNALWYRVSDIRAQTSANAIIELDRPAAAASTRAILMKNIVDVYHVSNGKDIKL